MLLSQDWIPLNELNEPTPEVEEPHLFFKLSQKNKLTQEARASVMSCPSNDHLEELLVSFKSTPCPPAKRMATPPAASESSGSPSG